jgi:hypothetical protein
MISGWGSWRSVAKSADPEWGTERNPSPPQNHDPFSAAPEGPSLIALGGSPGKGLAREPMGSSFHSRPGGAVESTEVTAKYESAARRNGRNGRVSSRETEGCLRIQRTTTPPPPWAQ